MDVTARDVAGIFEVDTRTVARWVKDGAPSTRVGRERRFPLGPLVRWRVEREVARALAQAADSDPAWRAARARKMEAQAAREEMALARERAELVPVDAALVKVGEVFDTLRAAILTVPVRFAPDIIGAKTLADAGVRLREIADELLVHLSAEDVAAETRRVAREGAAA